MYYFIICYFPSKAAFTPNGIHATDIFNGESVVKTQSEVLQGDLSNDSLGAARSTKVLSNDSMLGLCLLVFLKFTLKISRHCQKKDCAKIIVSQTNTKSNHR